MRIHDLIIVILSTVFGLVGPLHAQADKDSGRNFIRIHSFPRNSEACTPIFFCNARTTFPATAASPLRVGWFEQLSWCQSYAGALLGLAGANRVNDLSLFSVEYSARNSVSIEDVVLALRDARDEPSLGCQTGWSVGNSPGPRASLSDASRDLESARAQLKDSDLSVGSLGSKRPIVWIDPVSDFYDTDRRHLIPAASAAETTAIRFSGRQSAWGPGLGFNFNSCGDCGCSYRTGSCRDRSCF